MHTVSSSFREQRWQEEWDFYQLSHPERLEYSVPRALTVQVTLRFYPPPYSEMTTYSALPDPYLPPPFKAFPLVSRAAPKKASPVVST